VLVLARHDSAIEPLCKTVDLGFQHATIGEFEKADSFRSSTGEHRPEGREKPTDDQRSQCGGARRCAIERTSERIAEPAGGIEAVSVADSLPFLPAPDVAECESKPACALVCVEGDAVVSKEPSPDFEWIEVGLSQVLILPAACGLLLYSCKKSLKPRWRSAQGLHRTAAFAGAIAGGKSITDGRVKLDVLRAGLLRSASRAAENASGADSSEEDSVIRAIPLSERSVHCACRRHGSDHHATQFTQCRSAFHRKLSIEFVSFNRQSRVGMDEELKKGWEQLEEGLTKAMGRLSEAIEKAKGEMPDAMKSINEEYLRVQEALDRAVDKLRK
jgi:hypothetical protein